MNTSTKVFKVGNLLSKRGLCQDCSGRGFSSCFTEEVVEISGPLFQLNFQNQFFFSSGNGSRPDVLEISPNLLLGKMKRLCAFFSITSWAFALSVGDSQQTTVPLHCPLLNLSQRALLPALMVFARKRRGADFI